MLYWVVAAAAGLLVVVGLALAFGGKGNGGAQDVADESPAASQAPGAGSCATT